MSYYVLAVDEDGPFVATVKVPTEERAIALAESLLYSPSMRNFEVVKVVKHIEKAESSQIDNQQLKQAIVLLERAKKSESIPAVLFRDISDFLNPITA
jgi:hypothetical protein